MSLVPAAGKGALYIPLSEAHKRMFGFQPVGKRVVQVEASDHLQAARQRVALRLGTPVARRIRALAARRLGVPVVHRVRLQAARRLRARVDLVRTHWKFGAASCRPRVNRCKAFRCHCLANTTSTRPR